MAAPDYTQFTSVDADRCEDGRWQKAADELGMALEHVEPMPGSLEVYERQGDRWLSDGWKLPRGKGRRTIHGASYAFGVIEQTSALFGHGEVLPVVTQVYLRDPADWRDAAAHMDRAVFRRWRHGDYQ